jgi:hypothetical protein
LEILIRCALAPHGYVGYAADVDTVGSPEKTLKLYDRFFHDPRDPGREQAIAGYREGEIESP